VAKHTVSVMVSSYNQPRALRLVMAGFAAQDELPFEVVIADDGSDADTLGLVEEFRTTAPFEVRLVTQRHEGYRLQQILNKAVLESRGTQLIFCNGDCVPFRNLVAIHKAHYRPGTFCTAGRLRLTIEESRRLTSEGVSAGVHEDLLTLKRRWWLSMAHCKNVARRLMGRQDQPSIRGCHFSIDRRPLLDVNGFDESYEGCGKEDCDLRNRLQNAGFAGISLWHRAFVCHLDHQLDPRSKDRSILRRKADRVLYAGSWGRIKTLRGLDLHMRGAAAHLEEASGPTDQGARPA